MNKFSKSFLVFAMGFFVIAAQTLLFREFISSFESNDIAVAMFFASWFLWIAVSACLFGKLDSLAAKFAKHIDLLLLGYIPAFILQLILIIQAREIAGIASYSLFPINSMFLMAVAVNFPVSFITGLIFPAACRYLTENSDTPVSRVYLLEAIGSVSGGIAVTILLFLEVNGIMIFMVSSLLLSIAFAALQSQVVKRRYALLLPCLICMFILGRMDKYMLYQIQEAKWSKLLPVDAYKGSFTTPQAEYLFGNYDGQWIVVRDGSVCATFPDRESAASSIAINLCQQPEAENILIIGSGINLSRELLKLSQIKHINWFYPDHQFVGKVNGFLPDDYRITDPKVKLIKNDIRTYLAKTNRKFDSVIINLSNPDSSSLNRYFTADFFNLLKKSLSRNGVVGLKISGGENVMGVELAYIGASVMTTLSETFSKIIIKPGETSWFIASDSKSITDDPIILSENFAKIANIEQIFPPAGLYSLYFPKRSAEALKTYDSVDLSKQFLLNKDSKPHVYLYELLLTCKQSGFNFIAKIRDILYAGLAPFIASIVMFMFIWIIYARGVESCAKIGESFLLVLTSGILGIGTAISLMFLYQTRFGSLFLHIGIISSLFMLGLTLGASLARNLTINKKISNDSLMFCAIPLQILLFAIIAYGKAYEWNHFAFGMAFLLPGFCNGIYFPIAAARLDIAKLKPGKSGSLLENADHSGAAIGSIITGICLIPLLGIPNTMLLFSILLAINIPIALFRILKSGEMCTMLHFLLGTTKNHVQPRTAVLQRKNISHKFIRILKGGTMNTQKHSVRRKSGFFFIGIVILFLTFILTVKLAGKTQKSTEKTQTKQIEKPKESQKSIKSVEKLLAPSLQSGKEEETEYAPASSEIKKVNMKKIKNLIKEKKLSNHEAEFYKKF